MDQLILRRATRDDSKDLFDWRNDPATRRMSRNSETVEWSVHSSWFSATLRDDDRLLLICEDALTNNKIGMVRFDLHADVAEMSINIAPTMRGRGYAKPCLREGLNHLFNLNQSVKRVSAEVKSTNIGSRKSFEGIGFEYQKTTNGVDLFEYVRDSEKS